MAYQVVQNKEMLLEMCKEAGTSFPYSDDISPLSKEIKVGTKTVHNRIVYQAMEGCDGTFDGAPDELTKRRYLRFARGGAGIIWFEATAVMKEGRANPRQLYINENTLESYPFEFEYILTFELKGKALVNTMTVVNKTKGDMYFSVGAHPGFNC